MLSFFIVSFLVLFLNSYKGKLSGNNTHSCGPGCVYIPITNPPPWVELETHCTGANEILACPLAFARVVSASQTAVYSPGVSIGAAFLIMPLGILSGLLQIPEGLRGLHVSTRLFIPHLLRLLLNSCSWGCLVCQPNVKCLVAMTLYFSCASPVALCLEGELVVGTKLTN